MHSSLRMYPSPFLKKLAVSLNIFRKMRHISYILAASELYTI